MKKDKKIYLFVISILFGIVLLDSIQALVFDNSPFLKIRKYYNGGALYYQDKGLFVDTYCSNDGKKDTVIKGFSYSLSSKVSYEIVDTSKEIEFFTCNQALEEIFEDSNYVYYLSCIKSDYIEVRYSDGKVENIITALNNGNVKIDDLDKFEIDYFKDEK